MSNSNPGAHDEALYSRVTRLLAPARAWQELLSTRAEGDDAQPRAAQFVRQGAHALPMRAFPEDAAAYVASAEARMTLAHQGRQ